MYTCDVTAKVDFGKGPVEIRCTQIGEDHIHKCEVMFVNVTHKSEPISHNIFESEAIDERRR